MEQLAPLLDKAATTIGLTVNHVWPLLVAITFWTSLFWAIADPVIVGVYIAGIVWFWKRFYPAARQMTIDLDVNEALANDRTREERREARSIRIGWQFDTVLFSIVGACWLLIGFFFTLSAFGGYPMVLAGVFTPEGVTVLNLLHQLLPAAK